MLVAFQALAADPGELPDWILASSDARAVAGQPFEVLLVSLGAEPPPDEINVRLKADIDERILRIDRKSTRLNSSHGYISYAVFCLKKKHTQTPRAPASHP